MGQTQPLFVYFRPSLITISIIQNKSIDGVLEMQTRVRRMAGADDTTELWQPPMCQHILVMFSPKLFPRLLKSFVNWPFCHSGIWLHVEGDNSPHFDADGFVLGPDRDGTLVTEIRKFLDVAKSKNILVVLVLWNGAVLRNQVTSLLTYCDSSTGFISILRAKFWELRWHHW